MRAALTLLLVMAAAAAAETTDPMQPVLARMYNFDFAGAHALLDKCAAKDPMDPVVDAFRAAAYLFSELSRVGALESEFLKSDKRIAAVKVRPAPDPEIKARMLRALDAARTRAQARLSRDYHDSRALFAMAMAAGVRTDYLALVEGRRWASLSDAKESQAWAVRLLNAEPKFYDAYLTAGLSEYLVGSLPFFLRWFVRFEQVDGDKQQAVKKLEVAARSARYLGPFAKILLAIIHLREKRPARSVALMRELVRDYPENPLFRKELAMLDGAAAR